MSLTTVRCPHCQVSVRKSRLPRHYWLKHGRVLDGKRARKPWNFLDAATPDKDPADRLTDLARAMQSQRLGEAWTLDYLRTEAKRLGTDICPKCFSLQSLSKYLRTPMKLTDRILAGQGYQLALRDGIMFPQLRIDTPSGRAFDGPEPGGRLTAGFLKLFGVGLLVILALILAMSLSAAWALVGVASSLFAGLLMSRWIKSRPEVGSPDRLIDHAWRFVGDCLDEPLQIIRPNFLASLAEVSVNRGDPKARKAVLERVIAANPDNYSRERVPIRALWISDAKSSGLDYVAAAATIFCEVFEGNGSPVDAEELVAAMGWGGWPDFAKARLRILVLESAFQSGCGVWDIDELGRNFHNFGQMLGAEDTDALGRVHHLWRLLAAKPWISCGPAATAFEVAHYPDLAQEYFSLAGDLILEFHLRIDGVSTPLVLAGRGLLLRGKWLTSPTLPIAIRTLPNSSGGGHELRWGASSITVQDSAHTLTQRLEKWVSYWFDQFLPGVEDSLSAPVGEFNGRILNRFSCNCIHCKARFLGRSGEVGIRVPND